MEVYYIYLVNLLKNELNKNETNQNAFSRFLFYYRELQDGNLRDHNLMDGSKIILIPNVETGLLVSRSP